MIGVTACVHSKEIPKDFFLQIETFAVQPGGSGYAMSVSRNAETGLFELRQMSGGTMATTILAEEVVKQMVDAIRRNSVMRMKDSYADFGILDGETSVLTVRLRGAEKRVQMRNIIPGELTELYAVIRDSQR